MNALQIAGLIIGLICMAAALLPFMFAALGFLGILADVSPAENRQMGLTLLGIGAVPLVVGAGLVFAALATRKRR